MREATDKEWQQMVQGAAGGGSEPLGRAVLYMEPRKVPLLVLTDLGHFQLPQKLESVSTVLQSPTDCFVEELSFLDGCCCCCLLGVEPRGCSMLSIISEPHPSLTLLF